MPRRPQYVWSLAALAITLLFAPTLFPAVDSTGAWPSFRGPSANGLGSGKPVPVEWNVASGENIRWKAPIPGLGHSSPVIWGDRLYVTSAVSESGEASLKIGLYGDISAANDNGLQRWNIYCLDTANGKVVWQQTAREGLPYTKRHTKATHANSSPATDGEHVVCSFGAEGLHCYSVDGRLLWKKDLGRLDAGYYKSPSAQWGFGSSPIIHRGRVIVQCDVQTNSFLAAFNVTDGKEVWRVGRDELPTWSTPTVVSSAGRVQIVVNGYKHSGGYDPATGRELWKLKGGGDIPVPTPVFGNDLIFLTSAHGPKAPIYAVKPEASGNITLEGDETHNQYIAWSQGRRGNYMQTPIIVGPHLYCCHDIGMLACYDARTGTNLYSERLGAGGSGFTASPVAADGKLYFVSEPGMVYVIQAGAAFKVLAQNDLLEPCMASPAISSGVLFFRTRSHIVAVAAKP